MFKRFGTLIVCGLLLGTPALAQTSELPFEEEMNRSVYLGATQIDHMLGFTSEKEGWAWWDGTGPARPMTFANSIADIRAGHFETRLMTGEGLRHEKTSSETIGLTVYGRLGDQSGTWIKIINDDTFLWYQTSTQPSAGHITGIYLPDWGTWLTKRTIEMAETPDGPVATYTFKPDQIDPKKHGEHYGMAYITVLEQKHVEATEVETYWDKGLEPEASAPKNIWVKIRVHGAYTEYNEISNFDTYNDPAPLAEGWIRAYDSDGRLQIAYSATGC